MGAEKRKLDTDNQGANKKPKADVQSSTAIPPNPPTVDEIQDIHSGLFYLNITQEEYRFNVLSLVCKRGTYNFTATSEVELVLKNGTKFHGKGITYLATSHWDVAKWAAVQKMAIIEAQIAIIAKLQIFDRGSKAEGVPEVDYEVCDPIQDGFATVSPTDDIELCGVSLDEDLLGDYNNRDYIEVGII
jgi:hypothetical protein